MSTTKSMSKQSDAVKKAIQPKILKTEADYEAALTKAEALFEASPGTPRGEELELWLLLIEQYESITFPLELPDPVAAIRFRMEQQNLNPRISCLTSGARVRCRKSSDASGHSACR